MKNLLFKTFVETKTWLDKVGVEGYTIRDDLVVDVNRGVDISKLDLTHIPVQFGVIKGHFSCASNNLGNLLGSPSQCNEFYCDRNQLTSLIGAPKKCFSFSCSHNQLKSLEHSPAVCLGSFDCDYNQLTRLDGLSVDVGGSINCHGNPMLCDISAANGCAIYYDHEILAKNQAAWQLAKLEASNGKSDLPTKPGRTL